MSMINDEVLPNFVQIKDNKRRKVGERVKIS